MQSFEFDIQYRPGERMAHVDFLSRNPVPKIVKTSIGVVERHINLTGISEIGLNSKETNKLLLLSLNWVAINFPRIWSGTLYRKVQSSLGYLSLEKMYEFYWFAKCLNIFANL